MTLRRIPWGGCTRPWASPTTAPDLLQPAASRERTLFAVDGFVRYGQLRRTGANEPTVLHVPAAGTIAGIEVESYSVRARRAGGRADLVLEWERTRVQIPVLRTWAETER